MATQNSLEDFDLEKFQQEVFLGIERIRYVDRNINIGEFNNHVLHGNEDFSSELNSPMQPAESPVVIRKTLQAKDDSKPPSVPSEPNKFFIFAASLLWVITIKVIFPNASTLQTVFLFLIGGPLVYWVAPKKKSHSLCSDAQGEAPSTASVRSQGIIASESPPRNSPAAPAIPVQMTTKQDQKIKEEEAKRRLVQLFNPEVSVKLEEAEEIVKRPSIKKLICPAIMSVTNDAFEYSKVLTPLLVAAVIAKTIVLPLDSLLFAAIAFVVAKGGASTICADYAPEKK